MQITIKVFAVTIENFPSFVCSKFSQVVFAGKTQKNKKKLPGGDGNSNPLSGCIVGIGRGPNGRAVSCNDAMIERSTHKYYHRHTAHARQTPSQKRHARPFRSGVDFGILQVHAFLPGRM